VRAALVHLDVADQSERVVDAIRATADDTAQDIAEMEADEGMTRNALDLLGSRRNDHFEAALAALREDTRAWWAATLARDPDELEEDEAPVTADAEGLRRFLEAEVLPWFETRKKELANRPLIREQAFGEALDPDKLERLGRYEVHLDRKLERMLTMLLRLKDLRQETIAG
jgi:acyl-CoA synthetase (NDP forming)